MAEIDVYSLLKGGQRISINEGRKQESTKVGTLRAGNTGLLTEDGKIIGPCMGQTYLRHIGIDTMGLEDDGDSGGAPGRELMFEAGRVNEDLWVKNLEQTWEGPILREEDIATTWETSKGVKVTGRPDIVLCHSVAVNGKTTITPQLGLELKQVSSFWTAYQVLIKGQPKFNHLLQAGHYAWQLGIPFEVWYTSRTDYHIIDWISSHMPKLGEANSEYVAYSYFAQLPDGKKSKVSKLKWDKLNHNTRVATPLKLQPFIVGYKIEIRNGTLFYKAATASEKTAWTKTSITIDGIQRYYETITTLEVVPPEPTLLKADGTKENYKARDYCALGELCCAYQDQRPIEGWVSDIRKLQEDKK